MKVEIEDVLFWMDAIRNSKDRYRTLESFWKGQVRSKIWLIESLQEHVQAKNLNIIIHGGWNGVLASLLFNSEMSINHITSVDIDPNCETIAYTVNKRQEMLGKFRAITHDMCSLTYDADIVINTSCEHISQEAYDRWIKNVPPGALLVLQSNNYYELDEHIRCASSLDEFKEQSQLNVLYASTFDTGKYERYMIIGYRDV